MAGTSEYKLWPPKAIISCKEADWLLCWCVGDCCSSSSNLLRIRSASDSVCTPPGRCCSCEACSCSSSVCSSWSRTEFRALASISSARRYTNSAYKTKDKLTAFFQFHSLITLPHASHMMMNENGLGQEECSRLRRFKFRPSQLTRIYRVNEDKNKPTKCKN